MGKWLYLQREQLCQNVFDTISKEGSTLKERIFSSGANTFLLEQTPLSMGSAVFGFSKALGFWWHNCLINCTNCLAIMYYNLPLYRTDCTDCVWRSLKNWLPLGKNNLKINLSSSSISIIILVKFISGHCHQSLDTC